LSSMAYLTVGAAANRAFDLFVFIVVFMRQYAVNICFKGMSAFFAKGIHFFFFIICIWHRTS
jgi:hypothetical protein